MGFAQAGGDDVSFDRASVTRQSFTVQTTTPRPSQKRRALVPPAKPARRPARPDFGAAMKRIYGRTSSRARFSYADLL